MIESLFWLKVETVVKIAIIGSRNYQGYTKIKDFLFYLKQKYEDKLIIASGGDKLGIDKFVKEICKWKLDIKYVEFPPYHQLWTIDCKENGLSKFMYGKEYKAKYFFIKNFKMIDFSDVVIFFINHNTFIQYAKNKNKKVLIV